jgi:hypothetical protein
MAQIERDESGGRRGRLDREAAPDLELSSMRA